MMWDTERVTGDASINISEELVDLPNYKRPNTANIDFDGLLQTPLVLHEDVSAGCGGQTWPAGMVLANLELGAGSGLVGLAIARALSSDFDISEIAESTVQMTDQEAMLPLMQRNIDLNQLPRGLVSPSILDWGTNTGRFKSPDILIAAECVYFEPAFPLLLQTMIDLIGPDTVCYFCFKKRRRADLKFIKDAKKRFKVDEIVDDPDRESWSRQGLFFYRITAKGRQSLQI